MCVKPVHFALLVITFKIEKPVFGKCALLSCIPNSFSAASFLNFFVGHLDFKRSYFFKQDFKVSTICILIFTETFQVLAKNFIETIIFVPNIFQQDIYFDKLLKGIIVRAQCLQISRTF